MKTIRDLLFSPEELLRLKEHADVAAHLFETCPFVSTSGEETLREDHVWNVRPPGDQHDCPERFRLIHALVEALVEYWKGQTEMEQELQKEQEQTRDALEWIAEVLIRFFPKQKKLARHYEAIAKAALSVSHADYARLRSFKRYRSNRLKARLTRHMCEVFQQFRPFHYSDDAIFWAVAKILESFQIEEGATDVIVDRLKKRWYAPYHTRRKKTP